MQTDPWTPLFANPQIPAVISEVGAVLRLAGTNDGSGDIRRLKGIPGCRLRIGDWRIIFVEDARSITVVAVGHRREIYD